MGAEILRIGSDLKKQRALCVLHPSGSPDNRCFEVQANSGNQNPGVLPVGRFEPGTYLCAGDSLAVDRDLRHEDR